MEYGNSIPRFPLPHYRSQPPPVLQQVIPFPSYEDTLDALRLQSYGVQGPPYRLPEQLYHGRLQEQQYLPPPQLQAQSYQTQEYIREQRLLEQRTLLEQHLLEQQRHIMEPRMTKQRLNPLRIASAHQCPTPLQTLQQAATADISDPISNQILDSDHIISDPILTDPLADSLAQQTPPAEPIPTDQGLDGIQETNNFTDGFEGLFEDWDIHNNTRSPRDVAMTRPKDMPNNSTTIEDLKR